MYPFGLVSAAEIPVRRDGSDPGLGKLPLRSRCLNLFVICVCCVFGKKTCNSLRDFIT